MNIGSVYVCDRKREGTLLVCDVKILTKSILEAFYKPSGSRMIFVGLVVLQWRFRASSFPRTFLRVIE